MTESTNWALEVDSATATALPEKLVAFDFDGTLTIRDSFRAFLGWMAGPRGYVAGIAKLAPDLVRYLVRQDRGQLKAAMLSRLAGDLDRCELEQAAETYAEIAFDQLIRIDGFQSVKTWLEEKAQVVIVTASPEFLVAPFGRRLGNIEVIGSRLGFDGQNRLNGHLEGRNCRGPEKVIRLKQRFGQDVRLLAAYGDTKGDRELLAFAANGHYRTLKSGPLCQNSNNQG